MRIPRPFILSLLVCAASPLSIAAGQAGTPVLPAPTGPQKTGTTTFALTRDGKTLVVQAWYPAATDAHGSAAYLEPALLAAFQAEKYMDLAPDVLESWGRVRSHSTIDAPLAAAPARLPLLIFSHGVGVSRVSYSSIAADLASHGYVVAAIDHPGVGLTVLPDGQVSTAVPPAPEPTPAAVAARVESMAADAALVADALIEAQAGAAGAGRFAGRIDAAQTGAFGHSIGGAAALEACRVGGRFKACADLDGDVWGKVETEGVGRPFLVLLNEPVESRRPPQAMREQRDKGWADVIARQPVTAFVVKVASTNHFSFTDFPFVVPEALMQKNGAFIAPARGLEVITGTLRAFFGRYLLGEDGPPLEDALAVYGEAEVKAFRAGLAAK